jgi:hypothetical protein
MTDRSREVRPEQLAGAIAGILDDYSAKAASGMKTAARDAAKSMADDTKATAPGAGRYKRAITFETDDAPLQAKATWGVRGKMGNLSHLLERGHATLNGGRTRAFRFIEPALDKAVEKYLDDVRKAVEDAGR